MPCLCLPKACSPCLFCTFPRESVGLESMGAVRWCEAAGARCQHKPVQMWPGDRAGSSFPPYLLEGLASVCRVLNLLSRLAARWLCSKYAKKAKGSISLAREGCTDTKKGL